MCYNRTMNISLGQTDLIFGHDAQKLFLSENAYGTVVNRCRTKKEIIESEK